MFSLSQRAGIKAAAVLGVLYLLGAAALSSRFPPLNGDEVFVANHGYNMVTGQQQRYSLFDDIFAPDVYGFRDAFLEGTRPLWDFWVGLFVGVSRTYTAARASSYTAGLVALAFIFLIGCRVGTPALGLLMMSFFLVDPTFWVASCVVRPELPLLAVSAILLERILRRGHTPWQDFGFALIAGLATGIHPNALLVSGGLLAVTITLRPERRTPQAVLPLAAGFIAGLILLLGLIDMDRFKLARQTFLYPMYKPPLLTWPWHPVQWLKGIADIFVAGPTYYFDAAKAAGWESSLRVHWLGMVLLLAFMAPGHKRPVKALAAGAAVYLMGMIFLVARREALYTLEVSLFLVPIAVLTLSQLPARLTGLRWIVPACLAVGLGVFIRFVQNYVRLSLPYDEWVSRVTAVIPKDAPRIAGPSLLWFELAPGRLRDMGALMYSRYYTGRSDVGLWLSGWKPDVIIVDDPFKHLFLQNGASARDVQKLLHQDVSLLGSVNTGAAYGTWDVYRVTWTTRR